MTSLEQWYSTREDVKDMADDSSNGFTQGALVGGGIVFFVAGAIILTGIPGGGLGSGAGAPTAGREHLRVR